MVLLVLPASGVACELSSETDDMRSPLAASQDTDGDALGLALLNRGEADELDMPVDPGEPSAQAPPLDTSPYATSGGAPQSLLTLLDLAACEREESVQACCLATQSVFQGDDSPNSFSVSSSSTPPRCVLLYGGADQALAGSGTDHLILGRGDDLARGRSGADVILGMLGSDNLQGESGDDVLWGGAGDDLLSGGSGNDELRGGHGDDTIDAGTGNDWIVPGPGVDAVSAGSGNDKVELTHVCELSSGETLAGGSGTDTLRTVLPLASLSQLGVSVTSFETVELIAPDEASECSACACELSGDGTEVVCCGGVGTCKAGGEDGLGWCDCPDGVGGADCTYDPAEAIGDDPVPVSCVGGDPSCDKQYDGSIGLPPSLDFSELGACTGDLTKLADYAQEQAELGADAIDLLVAYPTPIGAPGVWAPGTFPIVLLLNANGSPSLYDETRYEDLALHWARNGFITVVAAPSRDNVPVAARAELGHCVRRLLEATPGSIVAGGEPLEQHWTGEIGYVGHSRGGEAAVIAAGWAQAESLTPPFAVIAMAPTALCSASKPVTDDFLCGYSSLADPNNPELPLYNFGTLTNQSTRGFLFLGGSGDGDTFGSGFMLLDRAFQEPGAPQPDDATVLASLWTRGVRHSDWASFGGLPEEPGGPGVPLTWGGLLARAYTLSFLRAQLAGNEDDRRAFVAGAGQVVPSCVANPADCASGSVAAAPRVHQFRDGGTSAGFVRLSVQSFTAGSAQSFGLEGTGPVTTSGEVLRREALPGFTDGPPSVAAEQQFGVFVSFRGQTAQLIASPGTPASLSLGLAGPNSDDPLDAVGSGVSTLSFRAAVRIEGGGVPIPDVTPGQITILQPLCDARRTGVDSMPAHAANDRSASLRLTLRDDGGTQAQVLSSDFGTILPADIRVSPNGPLLTCEQQPPWVTVRVPLRAFAEAAPTLDLASLSSVTLTLDTAEPEHANQTISVLLDSVELVSGICGDGVVDLDEVCDTVALAGETCASLVGGGGTLQCQQSCAGFDVSGCSSLPGCSSGVPGDLGCECLPVDPGLIPGTDGSYPDGPGSFGTLSLGAVASSTSQGDYCPDAAAPSGVAVCGLVPSEGGSDSAAACLACPAAGSADAMADYGCPCLSDLDCAPMGRTGSLTLDYDDVPLTCWGDLDGGWLSGSPGTCLPAVDELAPFFQTQSQLGVPVAIILEEFRRTLWLCKTPCGELSAVNGADIHDCRFRQGPLDFDAASCVEASCGGQPGELCANDDGHCGPNASCQPECDPLDNPADPTQGNPSCAQYGYPLHYRCTTWMPTQRCGPPECEPDPLSYLPAQPELASLCDALTYGNLLPN